MTTTARTAPTIKTRSNEFSFATNTTTKRRKWLSADYFDVEPTNDLYHQGDLDAFVELERLVKSGANISMLVRQVIKDAAIKMDDVTVDGKTRRWVAYGFMNLIDEAVTWALKNGDWGPCLQERIDQNRKAKERYEQKELERMKALTRRSVEVRQQRRRAKSQDALCASVTV